MSWDKMQKGTMPLFVFTLSVENLNLTPHGGTQQLWKVMPGTSNGYTPHEGGGYVGKGQSMLEMVNVGSLPMLDSHTATHMPCRAVNCPATPVSQVPSSLTHPKPNPAQSDTNPADVPRAPCRVARPSRP